MSTDYITPKQAAEHLPGNPSAWAVARLMREGTTTPCGTVKLKRIKHGTRNFTTKQWIDQYIDALDAAFNREPQSNRKAPRPTGRAQAAKSLEAEGIK